ncbi:MAG: PD-(D/E)XK nuclease family protein, partial [Clostridia bacterium]|nr:PD-(D/E)XK nuclease family protein [Clostridia bacterium]
PDNAPLLFEVTNFTRFANSVFRELGGVDKEYCDSAKSALIMWRTLSELAPTLSLTDGRKEINYGMVKRALATTGECDGLSVGVDELLSVRDAIGTDRRLMAKIDDLVSIISLYKKLLGEKYSDVGEDLTAAHRLIAQNPSSILGTAFFIEGFTSFTEPQYRLVELIMAKCDLTVLLDLPKSMRDSFEYSEINMSAKRLSASGAKIGCEVKLQRVDGVHNGASQFFEISRELWRKTPINDNVALQNNEDLRIFEAETPYEECDLIISDIKKRVMGGARFSDFAVIAADISSYSGILDVAAKRGGVPLFISKSRDASSFEAIKLIYTAISCVIGGFQKEDLISYAKCGLCTIEREDCDLFELYVEKWKINAGRFTDGIVWNMNPDGYSPFNDEKNTEKLLRLDKIRKDLITPLTDLKEKIEDARTVSEHASALYSFIKSISLYERIAARAAELKALGENDLCEENERIYKTICDALDTLCEVSGDEVCDAEGFFAQLKIVFSSVAILRIPAVSDSVSAVSANIARLKEKKHVYLIGVNYAKFPAAIDTDSYFTPKDKAILSEAGLPYLYGYGENGTGRTSDLEIKEAKSLYSFTKSLLYARESVTITYTAKSAGYSAERRAEVVDRIIAIVGADRIYFKNTAQLGADELLASPTHTLISLDSLDGREYDAARRTLIDLGYKSEMELAEKKLENDDISLSPSVTKAIYPKEIELSQTKIDSYNNCPLAYFCKYNLSLSEDERAEFDARNIGSFVHAVLENFFGMCEKRDIRLADITPTEKEEVLVEAANAYLTRIVPDAGESEIRFSLITKRLTRACAPIIDGLIDEFSSSRYMPRYFELRIGGRGELSPERLSIEDEDGNKTLIKGSIDRVDAYKLDGDVYVRVVDYKTGRKSFDPDELSKGKNLQMFLYLCAVIDTKNKDLLTDIGVTEGGRLIPAGVIYVKSDLGDVKIAHADPEEEKVTVRADQKRQGMILDDAASVAAMSADYLPVT